MSGKIETSIPKPLLNQIFDEQRNPRNWNEETAALLNPSIQAIPAHVPQALKVEMVDSDYTGYWVRDRNGSNPNHERAEQLRAIGFEYAKPEDVKLAVESGIQGEEVRVGDLRLMKIKKLRWLQIRKSQDLLAIAMAFPQKQYDVNDSRVMKAADLIPGIKTEFDPVMVEEVRGRRNEGNTASTSFGKGRKE